MARRKRSRAIQVRDEENPIGAGGIIALVLGSLAVGGLVGYFTGTASAAAATAAAAGSKYNASNATTVPANGSITVAPGTSVTLGLPQGSSSWSQNATSSNPAVLAPSVPSTNNGFVAVAAGTATLTGQATGNSYGGGRNNQNNNGQNNNGSVAVTATVTVT